MRGARTKTNRAGAWLLYAAFWLAVGLFLGIADLQHYLARGGEHPWEPFLWELSSGAVAGSLAVLVFRWHDRLQARPTGQRVAGCGGSTAAGCSSGRCSCWSRCV